MIKLAKYIEYTQTLIMQKMFEKRMRYKKTTVKYIFQKCNYSKTMIIVFSACTRSGIPARYNYMRTLKNVKCNKLFILDDYGDDRRGGYYLGRYPDFEFESATLFLLKHIIQSNKIEKCYFVGSSKGAYAALNFGLRFNESQIGRGIIIGAPQYYLGKYLSAPANKTTLTSMLGSYFDNADVLKILDGHLGDIIRHNSNSCYKQPIYLHYSENEHTYQEHIKDMIVDLKKYNYSVFEDVKSYTDHSDVSLYYPKFLLSILVQIEPKLFED